MLRQAELATELFVSEMPKTSRKRYGQFFTDASTARYMASLFDYPAAQEELSILDPGAGSGLLSIAVLERLQNADNIHCIHLTCYESDTLIVPLLEQNLRRAANCLPFPLHYEIVAENYITSQDASLFGDKARAGKYDLVIGNPPYKKISKDAPEAKAMPHVCHGAPNLYFLFASMGVYNLRDHGEMVFIIPRSWTSGAYFAKFRKDFLSRTAIEHIHLFASRNKVFEKESILQETIIVKVRKGAEHPDSITISTSETSRDFENSRSYKAPYDTVVHGEEKYVYLISSQDDAQAVSKLHKWKEKLPTIGLRMRTGLTVNFREKEYLRNAPEAGAVPLFYPHHIKGGRVVFPGGKENEYVSASASRLCQKNTNYLFVKRFTSKEERRRLQCGVYLARKHPNTEFISTQNKINFIDGLQELSECIVYGLYVLFNSSVYDLYYRILNGSTQVNSTEVNNIPVPDMSTIEAMGKDLLQRRDFSEKGCDAVLACYL